jgi:hypothetical protein
MAETLVDKYEKLPDFEIVLRSTVLNSSRWGGIRLKNLNDLKAKLKSELAFQRPLEKTATERFRFSEGLNFAILWLDRVVKFISDVHQTDAPITEAEVKAGLGHFNLEKGVAYVTGSPVGYSRQGPTVELAFMSHDYDEYEMVERGYKFYRDTDNLDEFKKYTDIVMQPGTLYTDPGNPLQRNASLAYMGILIRDRKLLTASTLTKKQEIQFEQAIADLFEDVAKQHADLAGYVDDIKNQTVDAYRTDFQETMQQYGRLEQEVQDDLSSKENRFKALEDAYQQHLAFEAPKKLWDLEAEKQRRLAKNWAFATIGVTVVMLSVSTWFINELFNVKHSATPTIPQYFVPIAVVSILLYVMRLFVNLAVSSWHMASEYTQKAAMTNYYLSMVKSNEMTKEEKQLILPELFAKIDTGLNKYQDNSTTDISALLKIMQR